MTAIKEDNGQLCPGIMVLYRCPVHFRGHLMLGACNVYTWHVHIMLTFTLAIDFSGISTFAVRLFRVSIKLEHG